MFLKYRFTSLVISLVILICSNCLADGFCLAKFTHFRHSEQDAHAIASADGVELVCSSNFPDYPLAAKRDAAYRRCGEQPPNLPSDSPLNAANSSCRMAFWDDTPVEGDGYRGGPAFQNSCIAMASFAENNPSWNGIPGPYIHAVFGHAKTGEEARNAALARCNEFSKSYKVTSQCQVASEVVCDSTNERSGQTGR